MKTLTLSVLLTLCVAAAPTPTTRRSQTIQERMDSLERQVEALKAVVAELQKQIAELRADERNNGVRVRDKFMVGMTRQEAKIVCIKNRIEFKEDSHERETAMIRGKEVVREVWRMHPNKSSAKEVYFEDGLIVRIVEN